MSQAYHPAFARAYNRFWSAFANEHAPRLLDFYRRTEMARINRAVLDVCCGTGNLAAHFLAAGFDVAGIDLSASQLALAAANCRAFVDGGRARFIQANAANFDTAEIGAFGLAVSTYDALNHLPDMNALRGCFRSVFRAVAGGGWFIFDLNTRSGLRRWNNVHVYEMADLVVIDRGMYDGQSDRAYTMMTGFIRDDDGLYQRFEQVAYDSVFDLAEVRRALLETGWREARFARCRDLDAPLDDPEAEERVFVIACK